MPSVFLDATTIALMLSIALINLASLASPVMLMLLIGEICLDRRGKCERESGEYQDRTNWHYANNRHVRVFRVLIVCPLSSVVILPIYAKMIPSPREPLPSSVAFMPNTELIKLKGSFVTTSISFPQFHWTRGLLACDVRI